MASTGLSWDCVEDELDVPRLTAMTEHWRHHPPVHVMVAAYLEYKPKEVKVETVNSPEEIEQMMRMFGAQL